ncbi:hypothetical protein [uncultured Phocaeicola sp.]|uniref:hypothetical protein n=1 Tax=uncultured Phocaeicola sp. TaxID=990718 RepID=UPI0025D0BE53|nr:hypothetical protein [uncultured Phocaeicola sp.]
MLHFIELLKKVIQENEFLRYIVLLGVIALSIIIIYHGGKEIGKIVAMLIK